MLAALCIFGLFAVVCAVVGGRLHRVSSSGRLDSREPWRHAKGKTFPRPQWFFPLIVGGIIIDVFLAFVMIGGFATIGVNFISVVLLIPVLLGGYVFPLALKMRGTPLAIIQPEGIILPRHHCEYLAWADVISMRAFNTQKSALLSFKVRNPAIIGSKSMSWIESGSDTVLLGIFDVDNPVVQAAKVAHNAWLRKSGTDPGIGKIAG